MPPHPPELNELTTQIANDNTELTCAYIQKTAIEIEKRLLADFDVRKLARQEGRYVFLCAAAADK